MCGKILACYLRSTAVPTTPSRLTSRQHPVVRQFREVAADPDGALVLLDGAHLIRDAVAAGIVIRTVLVTSDFLSTAPVDDRGVVDHVRRAGAVVHEATASVLDAASPVRTSSGIAALAEWTPAPLAATFTPAPALVLGLVDVQDPGNLGAIVRSADALGATGVAALDRSAHPGGWKALRGAMGSTFRLPVARADHAGAVRDARAAGLRVAVTTLDEALPLDRADLTRPTLVLLGNEGAGLPSEIVSAADDRIRVTMRAGVESLNVAATAALVLYEAARQRRA
jgi:TrmH family RNA methyltransferase